MLNRAMNSVLFLLVLSSCLGQEPRSGRMRGVAQLTGHLASVECDAGSSWNGRGWASASECSRKVAEGDFNGHCEMNDLGCFGIPLGQIPVPVPPNPVPLPVPVPTAQPGANCDAGSTFNGRGWPTLSECQRKVSEGDFNGSCGQNSTGCYGIPAGQIPVPPPPVPVPAPVPGPTGVPGAHCDAGSFWNGKGWFSQSECIRKVSEGDFSGSCDFNSLTSCFGIPAGQGTPPPPTELPPGPYPSSGEGIVEFVRAHWPDMLSATASLNQRKENMAFLRDRMIEVGICAGLDTGLNVKQSGQISFDYLTWQSPQGLVGVDIGLDYDNIAEPIRLYWGAKDDPFATYVRYEPRPVCR